MCALHCKGYYQIDFRYIQKYATEIYSVFFPLYRGRDDRKRDERKRRDPDRHGKSLSDSHRERERHERRRGSPRGRSYSRSRSRSGSRGKSRDRRGEKAVRRDQLHKCRDSCGRELLKPDRRAGCNCCQPYLQGIVRRNNVDSFAFLSKGN